MNNDNMNTPQHSGVDTPQKNYKSSSMPPYSEVDLPPDVSKKIASKRVNPKDINEYEKLQEIDLKDFMTKKGLRLLVCILIAMPLLVIIDTLVINFSWNASEHLSTVIDFGKYIATTLLGFLFANKLDRDSSK